MTLPLCKCGHTAFFHDAMAPHHCLAGNLGCDCQCAAFKVAPASAQPSPSPDAAEGRRLALLSAAAVLLSADHWQGVAQAAHEAEALLAEIERRAAERAKEGR